MRDLESWASTDAGRVLALFHWNLDARAYEEYTQWSRQHISRFAKSAIQRQPPDPTTNCHGWIFAEGSFVMVGKQVEDILKDNGYAPVPLPTANDIAVYRSDAGRFFIRAWCEECSMMGR